jgi:tRNA-intron endonuclease
MVISKQGDTVAFGFKEILEIASKDEPKFWIKYLVYRDLRYRGYVVRSGIGNSIDFRIYPRGTQLNTDTAKFLIFILPEGHPVKLNILDTLSRQSLSNRKDLLLAIVDQLGDISYYQLTNYNLQNNTKKKPFFEGIELKK